MASDMLDMLSGVSGNVSIKAPARAAATSPLTLSGEQTVDGVALVSGDRVLVTAQTSGIDNGIYAVDTGAWSRAVDADGAGDLVAGTMLLVTEGTAGEGTLWRLASAGTPGEGALTFVSAFWMADGTIGTPELAALAVTSEKLATDAVETTKIKDANITLAKLAADVLAVVGGKFAKVSFDRNLTAGAGGQAITGVGFTPKAVLFLAALAGSGGMSIGFSVGGSTAATLYAYNGTYTNMMDTYGIVIIETLVAYGKAAVTSFDADGFTLAWSTGGAPSGTVTVRALCFGW